MSVLAVGLWRWICIWHHRVCQKHTHTHTSLQCQASQAGGDDLDGQPVPSCEQQLENALKTGAFDIRRPLGQKFQAAHEKGSDQHMMYNQSQGHKQKSEFSVKWAKDYLLHVIHINTNTNSQANHYQVNAQLLVRSSTTT